LRGFGVTVLDQLSSQLAVDLDAISAAVASLQSGEGAHVIVK
jgi:hypothetical protein